MDWIINVVVWLIIGALAGWIASIVMKTNQSQGLLMDIIIGIVGAFLGGFLLNLIPGVSAGVTGLNIGSILTAIFGAIVLLAIIKFIRRRSG